MKKLKNTSSAQLWHCIYSQGFILPGQETKGGWETDAPGPAAALERVGGGGGGAGEGGEVEREREEKRENKDEGAAAVLPMGMTLSAVVQLKKNTIIGCSSDSLFIF